ncbi:protein translocase subunit SecD [Candidatus Uabimicrobium sp. HlEnr_7]|uniref:protein translocase subunit SecD n=1 Tax=Candidatus Uabimicrobium helgolandensis TaxID=3095367 RepID=UPI003557131B
MSEKTANISGQLIGILLLALACLLFVCPPNQRPFLTEELKSYVVNLGLDLKGGSELLYEVNPEDIDPTKTAEGVIGDTISIISERIHNSGIVKEPRVQRQGQNRILIQLPGLNKQDTEEIKKVIQRLGNLELRLVASPEVGVGDGKLSEVEERTKYDTAKSRGQRSLKLYERRILRDGYRWYPGKEGGQARLVWVGDPYKIGGQRLSKVSYDSLNQVINFSMKSEASNDFKNLTSRYKKQFLAIIFNNEVMAAPQIDGVIPDGSGILRGFSYDEAQELIKSMRSGSLEIQPELVHENTIGPSLGEDSVRLGIQAGVIGLGMVVGFIILYYLAAGLVASIALLLNILIVFAVLVIFRETLTLPGIAGLILTVGMSIDANIIIFERIREEKLKRLKANPGKETLEKEELLADVESGFRQAFSTIFDANLTTFLTAAILYFIASGTVQGFAFTMLWGIVASFFTAIFVTRVLLYFLIMSGLVRNLSMAQLLKDPKYAITSKMKTAAMFSIVVVGISLASFLSSSDRIYGLDLRGGVLAQISLKEPLATDDVRTRLREDFRDDLEVQHIVSDLDTADQKGWLEFAIRLPNVHQDDIDKINKELDSLSRDMRLVSIRLKREQKNLVEKQQQRDESLREIRRLKKNDADKEEVDSQREQAKYVRERIKDIRKKLDDYEAEMQKIVETRRDLINTKNEKAGIDELRQRINSRFSKELAPFSFGKITTVKRGKYRNFRSIKVNLRTPLPPSFIEELFKDSKDVFDDVVVSVDDYNLTFKAPEGKSDDELAQEIKKHLALARPSMEVESIKLSKDGGSISTILSFTTVAPVEAVNEAIEKCKFEDVSLKAKGIRENLVTSVTLLIDIPSSSQSDEEVKKSIEANLRDYFAKATYNEKKVHLSEPYPRFSQISGVVAKAQKAKAYRAIILSLILVLFYIAARFPNGWRFGFGAVVALVHDVAITLGVIAFVSNAGLVNVEINLPVIAALLTIVGYSLNDTIVIFDRLRENQMKEEVWDRLGIKKVIDVFNKSINQTLSRTLLTSLTTLFVVCVIFFLNYGHGSVMEGFAFTLIVGVIVGTYSSIFVASATVLSIENKHRKK